MRTKKRTLTLLEIMIVIFLITLITGAIGYNMKGTLDKGRAFRTEQGIEQLKDLLYICLAEGEKVEEIQKNPGEIIKKYGFAKNPKKILEDGWGDNYQISYDSSKKTFSVKSDNLKNYKIRTRPASSAPEAETDSE